MMRAGALVSCRLVDDGRLALVRRCVGGSDPSWRAAEMISMPLQIRVLEHGESRDEIISRAGLIVAPGDLIEAMPGPPGSAGKSLWEVIWELLSEPAREAIRKGRSVSSTTVDRWISAVFRWAATEGCVVAARPLPLQAGASYIAFPANEAIAWRFGVVTGQVMQRWPEKPPSFDHLRVFSKEEWTALHSPSPPAPAPAPASQETATFSKENLAAWFRLRVATWRKGVALPSEGDDLTAAKQYFGENKVPRSVFRQVRQDKTPGAWRKPGPRSLR